MPKASCIREDEEVRIHVEPVRDFVTVKELFGVFRLKRPVRVLLREIDRELDVDA